MRKWAVVLTEGKGGIYLNIHAQPGARQMQLRGLHGDAIKVSVREPAQDGKANEAIISFVADAVGLAKQCVSLASGHTSRKKRLFLSGDVQEIRAAVAEWLDDAG
ncbi:MAG TPA: DUF167 domain-containing protein [Mariprofundaceae bacterium]|nr:DUF167 domain-containing protein [Mariprofundaceae bacterium]